MIAWQIVLGVTMGLIYSGSLYFGMVLSEGSTEHGGYHEALIGMLEPVANPIWVLLALGEVPPAASIVGGLMVVSAVAWRTAATPVTTQVLPPE